MQDLKSNDKGSVQMYINSYPFQTFSYILFVQNYFNIVLDSALQSDLGFVLSTNSLNKYDPDIEALFGGNKPVDLILRIKESPPSL